MILLFKKNESKITIILFAIDYHPLLKEFRLAIVPRVNIVEIISSRKRRRLISSQLDNKIVISKIFRSSPSTTDTDSIGDYNSGKLGGSFSKFRG